MNMALSIPATFSNSETYNLCVPMGWTKFSHVHRPQLSKRYSRNWKPLLFRQAVLVQTTSVEDEWHLMVTSPPSKDGRASVSGCFMKAITFATLPCLIWLMLTKFLSVKVSSCNFVIFGCVNYENVNSAMHDLKGRTSFFVLAETSARSPRKVFFICC